MEKEIKKLKELADEYANLIVEETMERRKKEIVAEIKKNIVELEEKLAKLESEQPLQKKIKIMKTKKLKKFIKKNYSKEFVLNAYEFYADPPSYFLERLYTQDYDYILDVFLEECRENNVSILDAINYYIKNKKEKYECR